MQTVTETWFVCETCHCRYRSRDLALACEGTVLPPCPVAPGDAVSVRVRYGAPEPDVVKSVRVTGSGIGMMATGLPDEHATVRRLVAGRSSMAFHAWAVTVGERHQLGKDEDAFHDEVGLDDLAVDGVSLGSATW